MKIGLSGPYTIFHYCLYLPKQSCPVFNKDQDVSLCESVHRTSTCFRCYPSNQQLHDNNQQEYPHLFPYTLEKLTRPISGHLVD